MGIWPMSNHQKVSSGTSLTLETVNFLFYPRVSVYNKIIRLKYQRYYT